MSQKSIDALYSLLERRCDMSTYWSSPSFHCFESFPISVKAFPITIAIESQLLNGGVPRLAVNCCGRIRELVTLGIESYTYFSADSQLKAIKSIDSLLMRYYDDIRSAADAPSFQDPSVQKWISELSIESEKIDLSPFECEAWEKRRGKLLSRSLGGMAKAIDQYRSR